MMGAAPDGDESGKGPADAKFTQADLDRIIGERLTRQRSEIADKYGDLDTLKASATELQSIKDRDKTDADKVQDQIADLQSKLTAESEARTKAEAKAAVAERTQYGVDKGLPVALAKKLTGTTNDELDAEIDELKPFLTATDSGPRRPDPNGHQGQPPSGGGTKPSSLAAGKELYAKSRPTTNA
ncbi:hypothetical protein ABG82_18405 [Mycobacteroides immunogenum]|uniref:Scaffolding protein n=1 Tax=Mycobacteroides immunogenum TaxID=83262 RepID=A0A7V8LJW1_9MYCO|nr:hypothetical protein ABG82_18405 [Mycobacteroides immunogenum]ANO07145.1 hypothetical protein BAB75_18690 [Mycobacteroides immunogenum]KIU40279.1 hypothetical protein TL11_13275 [Mycobacteroides immunogenum]KPG02893.1 hypothetical protein AN909_26555 [Mycobacteroides immunogenum]KPG02980.1 hypothetical protein AN908_27005 [Mycobacteroides immunogenum]